MLAGAVIVLVTVVGLLDQIPGDARPQYTIGRVYQEADEDFFREMEASLPEGAMVFQLPVMSFPEHPPIGDVGGYDHLRGYILGSNKLRWSAGGITGRDADWQQTWESQPVDHMVKGLAAVGFDALYVDTWAYPDRGAALHESLVPLTGPPAGESAYGRMRWYDLRDVRDTLTAEGLGPGDMEDLRSAVLAPLGMTFEGIHEEEVGPTWPFRWMAPEATVVLDNPGDAEREVLLRLTPMGPAGSTLTATGPGIVDGSGVFPVGRPAELRLRLAPGSTSIEFSSDAGLNRCRRTVSRSLFNSSICVSQTR